MNIILKPFAWLLLTFYNIFGSYGLALFFFALVVKLILFPLSLKGKKSMIQMNMLSGRMKQIQTKYATDKNKQNEEIQKLYAKEKVNPMGGCLWSMLPLLILIPLYAVIRGPFFYLMDMTKEQLTTLVPVLSNFAGAALNQTSPYFQLEAAHVLFQNFNAVVADPAVSAFAGNLIQIDFNFFGANLAAVPNWQFWAGGISWNSVALFIIPLISAGTGFLFSKISMATNAVNAQSAAAANNSTNKTMMLMTPLISLFIGFTMPAGLSIYWISNNVLSLAQELISGKMLKKDYEAAAAAREAQEQQEKEEEKQKKREAAERKAQAIAEGKHNKGKKPAVAEKKSDAGAVEVSRVGIRSYARGRAYDPNRYHPEGPSPYREPGTPNDETPAEKALQRKSDKLEEIALEKAADDMIIEEIMSENNALTAQEADEDSAADVNDPWAELDEEIKEIQDEPAEEEPQKDQE